MKKKVLTLVVIVAVCFTSCKKDEMAKPSNKFSNEKVADKKDIGTWD